MTVVVSAGFTRCAGAGGSENRASILPSQRKKKPGHAECHVTQACAGQAGTQGRNLSNTYRQVVGCIETGGVLGARRGQVGVPLVLGGTSAAAGSMHSIRGDGLRRLDKPGRPPRLADALFGLSGALSGQPPWHCRRTTPQPSQVWQPLPEPAVNPEPQGLRLMPARRPSRRRGRGSG